MSGAPTKAPTSGTDLSSAREETSQVHPAVDAGERHGTEYMSCKKDTTRNARG